MEATETPENHRHPSPTAESLTLSSASQSDKTAQQRQREPQQQHQQQFNQPQQVPPHDPSKLAPNKTLGNTSSEPKSLPDSSLAPTPGDPNVSNVAVSSVSPPQPTPQTPQQVVSDQLGVQIASPSFEMTLEDVFGEHLDWFADFIDPRLSLTPASKRPRTLVDRNPPPAKKRTLCISKSQTLKQELKNLEKRFHVVQDEAFEGQQQSLLRCFLDSPLIPNVPPVTVLVPEGYPERRPSVVDLDRDYGASNFLSVLRSNFSALDRSGMNTTVTGLLHSWESCLRTACVDT
eukprot:m.203503 g.203503  ORF g.203503 m.203503 type:complete len:290 (-) comp26006_c0_seq2:121-990(-)